MTKGKNGGQSNKQTNKQTNRVQNSLRISGCLYNRSVCSHANIDNDNCVFIYQQNKSILYVSLLSEFKLYL